MTQKTPKIIQLTTPLDRFKEFDQRLDRVLQGLDVLGELYTDLGFREQDIEDLTKEQIEALKKELKDHSTLVVSLLQHPLVQVLQQNRDKAEVNSGLTEELGYPEGVWQHYKGTRYRILDRVRSTDSRLDGVTYQIDGKEDSQIYHISLVNFHKTVSVDRRSVKRFTEIN